MKGNGGFVTDKEEMDCSDHGGHDKAQHNGSVDPQVEEMLLKILVFWKNVTNIGSVVTGSAEAWRSWQLLRVKVIQAVVACLENYFQFLLAGPVTEPDV